MVIGGMKVPRDVRCKMQMVHGVVTLSVIVCVCLAQVNSSCSAQNQPRKDFPPPMHTRHTSMQNFENLSHSHCLFPVYFAGKHIETDEHDEREETWNDGKTHHKISNQVPIRKHNMTSISRHHTVSRHHTASATTENPVQLLQTGTPRLASYKSVPKAHMRTSGRN